MWEGPRAAAISDDEQWCIVIGLGFIAFPLRPGGEIGRIGAIHSTNAGNSIFR